MYDTVVASSGIGNSVDIDVVMLVTLWTIVVEVAAIVLIEDVV